MFNKKKIQYISLEEADKLIKLKKNIERFENKVYTSINLNDSILMLLSSIDYNKKIISRTLLQREVFLFYEDILNNIGLSEGASDAGFFPYKYGPYSIDVNLALSTLIFSGKILIENYYKDTEYSRDKKRFRFLTVFITDINFNDVANKYEELLADRGYTIERFHVMVQEKKHAWDQNGVKGITNLLLSKGFKEWYNKKTLKDVYPSINFGKITEDYRPRVKV